MRRSRKTCVVPKALCWPCTPTAPPLTRRFSNASVVQSTLDRDRVHGRLVGSGDWDAVQLRLTDQLRPLGFSTSALVERVDREVKTEHTQAAANIRQVQHWIFIVVPATVILTLLIAGTLGMLITRSITRPLEQLVEGSKILARGEFKHREPIPEKTSSANWDRYLTIQRCDCSIFMRAYKEVRIASAA